MSYPNAAISFPGLFGDWRFTLPPKLFDIGNGVYWYGVIIASGILLALLFCSKQAKKYGLTEDDIYDTALWAIPFAIVGARLYYVVFYLDIYRRADGSLDFPAMVRIWDGGLAIYGGIIAAFLTAYILCRVKKIPFGALADCCVMGLLIGQSAGRWGNFFNREAFGGMTELPWRMRLWISESSFIDVHPTFLYESLWNLVGLGLIYFVISHRRRFDGYNTCFYFLWYGVGRFFIEGLRTDSLYLFSTGIRVSQALSLVLVIAMVIILVLKRNGTQDQLYVNQLQAADSPVPAASCESSLPQESPDESGSEKH